MKFSDRIGKTQPNLQLDSMDDDLRNSLWNAVTLWIINPMTTTQWLHYTKFESIMKSIWFYHFKKPIDEIPSSTDDLKYYLRARFFKWDYLEVYNFIDFLCKVNDPSFKMDQFVNTINMILKEEVSGYRIIDGQLVPISNELELSEIEQALKSTEYAGLKYVNLHLKEALNKLADRKNPDYRNSVKESISAIESLCKLITNNPKTELGNALKVLEGKIPIHGALKQALLKLYGYTSDSDGIRHSLMEESNLDQEDARFMLISCSAFVNYLIIKADKSHIKLKEKISSQ